MTPPSPGASRPKRSPHAPARGIATAATVQEALQAHLRNVEAARSANTARSYRNALAAFAETLQAGGVDPAATPASAAQEDWIASFISALHPMAPATERLYLTAVSAWFEYLAAERLAPVNLARVRLLIRHRARRPGIRLPQFPRAAIDAVIDSATQLAGPSGDPAERLRALRDRAFLLTLADTGVRVHEACGLRRGDLDWDEGRAVLIGKGDRQAVVRFSQRALRALREYLQARAAVDGASGTQLGALPLFARHDRAAGARVLPVSTTTGRAIVHQRALQALGPQQAAGITPHSFRHYFVTVVLRASGGNLRLAQELARHRSIAVTQRYAHLSDDELDRGYAEVFEGIAPEG